jgi:glycyl-tRNA synthetase
MIMRVGSEKAEPVLARSLVDRGIVSGRLIAYYLAHTQKFFESLGIPVEKMRFREVGKDERPFYSRETWDFEVLTSLGWLELVANNNRADYDLKRHAEASRQSLEYVYPEGKKVLPHVWEVSIGLDRTFYAVIENALREEERNNEKRTVLCIKPFLAPVPVAVFPLLSNKDELRKKAREVQCLLSCYGALYDESGSIGRRYARIDEVGCPLAVTIDFDTLKDNSVTLRNRDTMQQKRIRIAELKQAVYELLAGQKRFEQM